MLGTEKAISTGPSNCWLLKVSQYKKVGAWPVDSEGQDRCSTYINSSPPSPWTRVWHSYGFWHERISEYIRVKKMTRTNIRIYSYEHFWHERISEYIRIQKVDTNEYPKIFVWIFWHERISEYIRIKFFDTNEYLNIFVSKFWYERINIRIKNIRIFEYIRHTLDKTGTSSVLLQSK